MFLKLLIAFVLLAFTVGIHALGFSFLIQYLAKKAKTLRKPSMWSSTLQLVWVACWLLLLHMAEIAVWGLFYYWQGCFPDAESAIYFSGVTYTTVGYGDLVLPEPWRMLAPSEALIGILMAGLSTGLFFSIVLRMIESSIKVLKSSEPPEIHDR